MFAYDLTLVDILAARRRIKSVVAETPLTFSYELSELTGAQCWFKMENLQFTGSFKLQGAANNILSLTPERLAKGLICASAGNHSQAVAFMAARIGAKALVVLPEGTPRNKIEALKKYGCETIIHGPTYDDAQNHAYRLARENDLTFVHAYLDPITIAGQGTATLEALLAEPDFDAIAVPAGGGGLMIGQGVAAKGVNPGIKVVGVQSQASPPWYYTFRDQRRRNDVEFKESIAEGLYGVIEEPNATEAFKCIDEILLVSEESILAAMRWMLETHHLIIEASAAVTIAALREHGAAFQGRKVMLLLSGSNVDADLVRQALDSPE